eukprot:3883055-Amphidinium_carterae.1
MHVALQARDTEVGKHRLAGSKEGGEETVQGCEPCTQLKAADAEIELYLDSKVRPWLVEAGALDELPGESMVCKKLIRRDHSPSRSLE